MTTVGQIDEHWEREKPEYWRYENICIFTNWNQCYQHL